MASADYGNSAPGRPRPKAPTSSSDESGFRADTVHGKTWGVRGQTPVVLRPGQRQSFSAASAVNSKGAFWFCTYDGALNVRSVGHVERMEAMHAGPRDDGSQSTTDRRGLGDDSENSCPTQLA